MQERRHARPCQYDQLPWHVDAGDREVCGAPGVRLVSDTIPSLLLCPHHEKVYEESKMGSVVDLRRHLI